ncbi:MAG: hypothetical protein SFV24_05330 [Gemmatimonadales bacterium]|nr:hypothetical protein [Gemmatimonadales bacterium]
MTPQNWHGNVAAALALALVVGPAAAQRDPCRDPIIDHGLARAAQGAVKPIVLYDGIQPLRRAPAMPIRFPATQGASACVALYATFTDQGGTLYLERPGMVGIVLSEARTNRALQAAMDAATQVAREMLQQDVFSTRPRPGTPYIVIIPLVRSHPLYQQSGAAGVTAAGGDGAAANSAGADASAMRDRGFREATFVAATPDGPLFKLGEQPNRIYFGLIRSLEPGAPILDQDAAEPNGRPSAAALARFRAAVLPHLRETAATSIAVEIWHYQSDLHLAHQPNSPFGLNEYRLHPIFGREIEVPIGIERWLGQRRSSVGPYEWTVQGRPTEHNTVGAIIAVRDSMSGVARVAAEYRAKRDSTERAAVLAGRLRVSERERAKPAAYRAKGLVYQPDQAWAGYRNAREIRQVFDGYYPDATREWRFGRLLFRAVVTYGDSCRSLLPRGSAMRISTRFREDYFGRERLVSADTIFVHPDFKRVFKTWFDNQFAPPISTPDELYPAAAMASPAEAVRMGVELLQVKETLKGDMAELFRAGCQAPVLRQFLDNLRRLADEQPTLQAELVPAVLPQPDDPPTTIGEACFRYDRDQGRQASRKWCGCVDRLIGPKFAPATLQKELETYSAFWERLTVPTGPYYDPVRACRR